jgi:thiol-disulfide isomerase/thioredoxin
MVKLCNLKGIMAVIAIIAVFLVETAKAQTTTNTQQAIQPIILVDTDITLEKVIKQFRGKKIYIDIWATWCKPCLTEFEHNEALKEMLAEHDVQQLYISLDFDDKPWIDFLHQNQYNLTGTHIRAKNGLHDSELLKLFFTNEKGNKELSVPRYVLINEKGKIMNVNAKRPSQLVAGEKLW